MKMLLFSMLIILTLPAVSAVNMRNGSYTEKWIDYIDPDEGVDFRVERHYSSRSLFIGLFGFGWCSSLETYLTITSDGILNLTECGGGLEITYYPTSFEKGSINSVINQIITAEKKLKKLSPTDVTNLRAQLSNNTKMRFEYANKLNLIDDKKTKAPQNIFFAKSKGSEKITLRGSIYERVKSDGEVQQFNKNGQLIKMTNPMGQWIQLHYTGKKLAYLVDSKGRRLTFSYKKSGVLSKISNGRGLNVLYEFENENLTKVTNIWDKTYTYRYDANHNLVGVDFPDNTKLQLSYNLQKDWVKSISNRVGCVEKFDFLMSQDDPQNHYYGVFEKKCPNKKPQKGKHEFWYKAYAFSKDKYLNRVMETYDSSYKDAYFHPFMGRPVSINIDNIFYKGFAYKLSGLLHKKEFKKYGNKRQLLEWEKTAYAYLNNTISKTVKTVLNTAGQVKDTITSKYKYNRRGLLSEISSGSQFVKLSYNDNGKIKTLKDEKNATIELTYDRATNKPIKIDQSGVGAVAITYDFDGEVESVKGPTGRNVASSVVEKFLQMLNFLGPMGEELKI